MRPVAGIIAVLALATAASAQPAKESIVVASDDPAFRTALDDALAPAGIAVIVVEHEPAPALAEIAAGSRALADREHATATVWLIAAPGSTTLVAYDRGVDRMLVRTLPFAAPLSDARSAEAARMARTMLRALRITPDTDLPPPRAAEAPALHPPQVVRPRLATSLSLGMRARGPTNDLAMAGGLAIAWRPDEIGLAISGTFAAGADVMTADLTGAIRDDTIAAVVQVPIVPRGRVWAQASAGAALHMIALRGTLGAGDRVDTTSFDPAARLGTTLAWALDPSVDVGLAMSADYLLRTQKYLGGTTQLLVVPRLQVTAALVLTLRVLR